MSLCFVTLRNVRNINSTLLTFCVMQIRVDAREPSKLFLIIKTFFIMQLSIRAAKWIDYKWDAKYSENQSQLCLLVQRPSTTPLGID